jgi:hypothetical protein
MLCGTKMLGGVLVFRRIAAAHMATAQTHPQVHPTVAHFQAFFAAFAIWLYALDLIEMGTFIGHGSPQFGLGGGVGA